VPVFKKGDARMAVQTTGQSPLGRGSCMLSYGRGEAAFNGALGGEAMIAIEGGSRQSRHDHVVSHIDHAFTLRALIDRAHAGKHAFAAFVDF
jgi:hypothetical protein